MTKVILRGVLGKKFGKDWSLEVNSVYEIFEAIHANKKNSAKLLADVEKLSSHFIVLINDKILATYNIFSKTLKPNDVVQIVPVVQGGSPMVIFIIGLILQVVSMILLKALSPKKPKDVKTSSSILGGIRNVASRNVVVPLGYGRMRVGSVVISNDAIVKKIYQETDENSTALGYLTLADLQYNMIGGSDASNEIIKGQGINPYIMI